MLQYKIIKFNPELSEIGGSEDTYMLHNKKVSSTFLNKFWVTLREAAKKSYFLNGRAIKGAGGGGEKPCRKGKKTF